MRSDNMITFKIYSKNVYCTYDDNDPILLYGKKYIVSEKELNEKKLDKNKIQKYSKDLLEELPKLRLSTMGTLEVKEEAAMYNQL
jgi:hypothetical protein